MAQTPNFPVPAEETIVGQTLLTVSCTQTRNPAFHKFIPSQKRNDAVREREDREIRLQYNTRQPQLSYFKQ